MEDLKISIRNTETASIELVPTDDGVEIIIRRREKKESESSGNPAILKAFCSKKKHDDSIDQKELLKFYKFYEPKMATWKNCVDPEKLWARWCENS